MTTPPTITTDRLMLRGHRIDDLDACAAMWADPDVYRHIGGKPRTREEVWLRLLRSIGQWTAFGYGSWLVHDRATGAFVGEVGLIEARRAIDPPIDATPEMGWALAASAQGRGYAAEALCAILTWCEGQGIARTTCIIAPENLASIRLAERVGYRFVGERRYHDAPTNVYEHGADLAALRADNWDNAPTRS